MTPKPEQRKALEGFARYGEPTSVAEAIRAALQALDAKEEQLREAKRLVEEYVDWSVRPEKAAQTCAAFDCLCDACVDIDTRARSFLSTPTPEAGDAAKEPEAAPGIAISCIWCGQAGCEVKGEHRAPAAPVEPPPEEPEAAPTCECPSLKPGWKLHLKDCPAPAAPVEPPHDPSECENEDCRHPSCEVDWKATAKFQAKKNAEGWTEVARLRAEVETLKAEQAGADAFYRAKMATERARADKAEERVRHLEAALEFAHSWVASRNYSRAAVAKRIRAALSSTPEKESEDG